MEFNELVKVRRSVRTYQANVEITDAEIKEIIEKAQQAPSWKNSQTARYYVANNPDAIAKVTEALPAFNQNSSANASLVVTTFVKDTSGFTAGAPDNELSNKWGAYDLGLANAYFVLAAKEAGYDTLIMGIRDAAKLRENLGIPKTEQIVAVIALGKAMGNPRLNDRKPLDDVVKFL